MKLIFLPPNSIWEAHLQKPARGETYLWCFSISDHALAGRLCAFLSEAEKNRARAYKTDTARLHFLIGHGALRRILSVLLACPADTLAFARGEHGKPYLPQSDVHFNLSHSGEYVALALSFSSPVGIDIQERRRVHSMDAFVSRFFHPQEAEEFSLLPEKEKPGYLFSRWALREAFLKGAGYGLALSPASFRLKPDPLRPDFFSVEMSPDGCRADGSLQSKSCPEDFSSWQLQALASPDRYAAALAWRHS